ncbi:hypothetical protein ABL78_0665 [Leptomonas seymouri]|uniref:Transmembrane protein n=1 Tax=Leptomonas seymouri TaxID=5684 RepID=A0A0N1PF73_LEPSE|nr:hypothetical protein ABL78_0665 [Leptomonas seymouri]|eukprot:KPI90283.1 hypothetical protein ABL78_0665 [Leptomonas seymouri]
MWRQRCQRMAAATPATFVSAQCRLSTRAASSATTLSAVSSPTRVDDASIRFSPPLRLPRCAGSGVCSPALFRPTRIARIPPQLMRLLLAGGAALLQVFLVAFQRESRRLKFESEATEKVQGTGGKSRMSAVEAVQVLGLDRSYPALFSEIQKAGNNTAHSASSSSVLLPLREGKAREEAKRNFERMFALAMKEENLFLAGKLSAAYRVCVNPMWDEVGELEEDQKKKVPPHDEREEN